MTDPWHVYVIAGAPDGPSKIGVARNMEKRCRDLQTGHPTALAVMFGLRGTRDEVYAIEARAHKALRRKRATGEWFFVAPAEAAEVVVAAVPEPEPVKSVRAPAPPKVASERTPGVNRGTINVITNKAAWAQYMRERRAEWKRRRLAEAEAREPSGPETIPGDTDE